MKVRALGAIVSGFLLLLGGIVFSKALGASDAPTSAFFLRNSNSSGPADASFGYGNFGDVPLVGDWDGNGTDTPGVYRDGTLYVRNSNSSGSADSAFSYGNPGDLPIVGDWNGDGIDTIGVVRNGAFYLRNSNSSGVADLSFIFGNVGDTPLVGDWNGDGVDSVGLYRGASFYLRNSNSSGVADSSFMYGDVGDTPLVGDWNGDGVDSVGLYRGASFYLRNSNSSGVADSSFMYGDVGDTPLVGDWNGDRVDTAGIHRMTASLPPPPPPITTTTASTTSTTSTTTTTTMPMGGGGMHDQCVFTSFCDNFAMPMPGGRGGDLDETRWSFSRITQATNPGANLVNNYPPVDAEFCTTRQVRIADNDSFICGEQFGESNHWMEAMNDQDSYVAQGGRILQPFDFAGRTSTLDFSVDAKTQGSHSAWIEAWLTADPEQVPHEDFPGTHTFPRQGVQFLFNADWCGSTPANALRIIAVYNGYQVADQHDYLYSPCFTTQDDHANHFQLRVSQNHVEVWASDLDGSHFSLRGAANVNLPFTRGYWSLEHAQYAADKFNSMNPTTYHWHAVSFDGPVLPPDRSYQVPDALTPGPNGSVNLGYQTNTPTFTLPNVNPTGSRAYLTFNVYWYSSPLSVNVTVNGQTIRVPDPTPDIASHLYQWHFLVVPIALSDLVAGTNTVRIANTGCADSCPTVANIDLEVVR